MDNAPGITEWKTNDTILNKTRQFDLDNGKLSYNNNNNNNKGILCELY